MRFRQELAQQGLGGRDGERENLETSHCSCLLCLSLPKGQNVKCFALHCRFFEMGSVDRELSQVLHQCGPDPHFSPQGFFGMSYPSFLNPR